MSESIISSMSHFVFVVVGVYSFFFFYIRARYDQIIDQKPLDVIMPENKIYTPIWGFVLFSSLAVMLAVRHGMQRIDRSYVITLLLITVVVMAIEASVFLLIAPEIL